MGRYFPILFFVSLISVLPLRQDTRAAPAPIYVDHTATGLNNGSSWANAYTDLQSALSAASSTDWVWVAEGTYMPGSSRTDTFLLLDGVEAYGGFPNGGGDGTFAARDWKAYPTLLYGGAYENFHVVTTNGAGYGTILDGFIVRGGKADGSGAADTSYGGGMYNASSSPTIRHVVFEGNYAVNGGGMANYVDSSPLMVDLYFIKNQASQDGGGLYNLTRSSPLIINTVFKGNTADEGGGIHNYFMCLPHLINVVLSGNQSASSGGGIFNLDKSDLSLDNVVLTDNKAGGWGGAIYNHVDSDPLVVNSIIYGNTAFSDHQISFSGGMTISYSILQGGCPASGATCTNLLSTDPQFVRAADIGADGVWGTDDDDYGDQRLEFSSPAIDAGDNNLVPADNYDLDGDTLTSEALPYDLQENPRFVDVPTVTDTGSGTAPVVDMGAFETPPAVVYVDLTATGGSNNGTGWGDAFLDLQDGLGWAESGPVQVWVAEGTYKPGSRRADIFKAINNVEVYGGFPSGGGSGTFEARNWQEHETILGGNIGNPLSHEDNCYHVVDVSGVRSSAVLDGFTIKHGHADGGEPRFYKGGGIYNNRGAPLLKNLKIASNQAVHGGGMYNYYGSPTLESVSFISNTASNGAGIDSDVSAIDFKDARFIGNQASGKGGGINNDNTKLKILGGVFQGNTALLGGAISSEDYSDLDLLEVLFVRNQAGSNGGGIRNVLDTEVDLVSARFFGNTADGDGGGIYSYDSDSTIINSVLGGNQATVSGGGMFNDNTSALEIINSTFSGNKSLGSFGGGLGIGASNVTVDNSIFWGNVGGQITPNMSTVDISYTNLQFGCPDAPTTCDHLSLLDPKFRRSPDPGADGSWGTADDDYGDLKLIMDSPAIDAGDNNTVPTDAHDLDGDLNVSEKLPFDVDGLPRFIDIPAVLDTGSGTPPVVDMGAFENQYLIFLSLIYK